MKHIGYKKGFTLIELLFVVLIIGAIVFYASISMRATSLEKAIVNTKVQMENLQQANSNYYITYGKWPIHDELVDANFLKEQDLCSVWAGKSTRSSCKNKIEFGGSCYPNCIDAEYVITSIELPNKEIANKLVTILPSSSVTYTTGTYSIVSSIVPIPSIVSARNAQLAKKWGWIESAGVLHATHEDCTGTQTTEAKIILPNCPSGFEGHYMQFYLKQRTGRSNPHGHKVRIMPFPNKCTNYFFNFNFQDKCCQKDSYDHYYVNLGIANSSGLDSDKPWVTAKVNSTASNGKYVYQYNYYMTFCVPEGSWYPDGALNNAEKQCTDDWTKYNKGTSCKPADSSPKYL